MKRRIRQVLALFAAIATAAITVLPATTAQAAPPERSYAFTTIDFPGATKTYVMDANARGDIVGYYFVGTQMHGFLLRGGTYTTLDYPGDDTSMTQANAINAAGDIAGAYGLKSGPAGNVHGFLLKKTGEWSKADYPEGTHLMQGGAFGILADGTMVGCYHDGTATASTAMYGYSTGPKGVAGFEYPAGKPFAMHYGITPDGKTIVGAYLSGTNTPDNWHGYLLNDGKVTPFDLPGKVGTQAQGVGPSGEVVGIYRVLVDKTWNAHGYVAETHGSLNVVDWNITLVDVPGATQTIVRSVNAPGDLFGYYVDAAGGAHGFQGTVGAASPAAGASPAAAPAPLPPSAGSGVTDGRSTGPAGALGAGLLLLAAVIAAGSALLGRRSR